MKIDPDRVIPNRSLSIKEGAIQASGWGNAEPGSISRMYYDALGKKYGFTVETPIKDFSEEALHALLYGTGGEKLTLSVSRFSGGKMEQPFEGVVNNLERRYRETSSDYARGEIEDVHERGALSGLPGSPPQKEVLAVTVGGLNIMDTARSRIGKAIEFMENLELTEMQHKIGDRVIKEILDRLGFCARWDWNI